MIITLKQTNTKRFPEISSSEAPKTILRELVTASNKTGIITGKANIGMRWDPLSDFAAMEAIRVKHTDKPLAPANRLTKKRDGFSTGNPKKRLNIPVNNTTNKIS